METGLQEKKIIKKKKIATKVRKFSFVSYLPLEDIIRILRTHRNSIKCYAVAPHYSELEKSDKHCHILCHTYSSWEYRAILQWFKNETVNTFVEPILSDVTALEYLTHKNEPEKVQYSEDIIINNNFDLELFEIQENGFLPLQFMLDGVKLVDIAKRFGKEFIYHYTSYRALYDDIKFYDTKQTVENVLEPIQEKLPF